MRRICLLIAFGLGLPVFLAPAHAAPVIENVYATDATPSGFSVIWQTSMPVTPGISIFADAAGTNDISSGFEIIPFPLHGGDPGGADEYAADVRKDQIRERARTSGVMKISVYGCAPQTTYYYKVHARTDGEAVSWPQGSPAEVVTSSENAFISDSRQLLISITNPKENFDATGWLVMAGTEESPFPISAYVGDGAALNQAYLNLGHLFGPDGRNWMPTGLQTIRLTLLGNDSGPVVHSIPLDYTGEFQAANGTVVGWDVSDVLLGDVNNDKRIDLADAILALQIVQQMAPAQKIYRKADVNNDGKIGLEEAIFALRFVLQLNR